MTAKPTRANDVRRSGIRQKVAILVAEAHGRDPELDHYVLTVGETVLALRISPQIILPMEYDLIRGWKARDYPLAVVLDALHSLVERLEAQHKYRDRKLPLRYAKPIVEEACERALGLRGKTQEQRPLTW